MERTGKGWIGRVGRGVEERDVVAVEVKVERKQEATLEGGVGERRD